MPRACKCCTTAKLPKLPPFFRLMSVAHVRAQLVLLLQNGVHIHRLVQQALLAIADHLWL